MYINPFLCIVQLYFVYDFKFFRTAPDALHYQTELNNIDVVLRGRWVLVSGAIYIVWRNLSFAREKEIYLVFCIPTRILVYFISNKVAHLWLKKMHRNCITNALSVMALECERKLIETWWCNGVNYDLADWYIIGCFKQIAALRC